MSQRILDIFDGVAPTTGMVLVETRYRYVVTEVHPVDSRQWHDRWRLAVRRLAPDEPTPEGAPTMEIHRYGPGDCPRCIAQDAGLVVPDFVVHRQGCATSP